MILFLQQDTYFPQSLNETCKEQLKQPELEQVYWGLNIPPPI